MAAFQRIAVPLPHALPRRISAKYVLVAAGVLAMLFALLQVNQFSKLTSTGYEIDQLNRARAAKQSENHALEAEVAQLTSLSRIDREARERLGLVPPARTQYLTVHGAQPVTRPSAPRLSAQPPAAHAPDPRTPWWKRAAGLIPFVR